MWISLLLKIISYKWTNLLFYEICLLEKWCDPFSNIYITCRNMSLAPSTTHRTEKSESMEIQRNAQPRHHCYTLTTFFLCAVSIRGGCLGLVLAAGCVGMAASSLMELQNNSGYFLHHVIFASFAVLSVLSIMLLPESKRKPLPDSMKDGENQRRPPLFLSRPDRDNLPLLRTPPSMSAYNPDNYSRLVSATRKMLTKENLPYRISVPAHFPLLPGSETQGQDDETLGAAVIWEAPHPLYKLGLVPRPSLRHTSESLQSSSIESLSRSLLGKLSGTGHSLDAVHFRVMAPSLSPVSNISMSYILHLKLFLCDGVFSCGFSWFFFVIQTDVRPRKGSLWTVTVHV